MKKLTLFIDTTKSETIKVALKGNGRTLFAMKGESTVLKAQQTLNLISALLKKHSCTLTDLGEIDILPGPGSFIGLRVGFTIANTLAFLLKIPVNKQSPPALPTYLSNFAPK